MQPHEGFLVLDGPFVPAPGDRQTRASHLQGFGRFFQDLGQDPQAFLERCEIDPGCLRNPDAFVDCQYLIELFEHCSEALNRPLFGLQLALRQKPNLMGSLVPLCRSAPDFRTALSMLCRYSPVSHSPQCNLQLVEGDRTAELWCGSETASASFGQVLYASIFSLFQLLREISEGEFAANYVTLRYDVLPSAVSEMETAFRCKVYTRQPRDVIGFSTYVLQKPLSSADRLTFHLLQEYFSRVEADQRNSLVQRVEDYIRGSLAGVTTLQSCASALGMNYRLLQDRLSEYGVSFSELLTAQKIRLAQMYLTSNEFNLDEIAMKLGYAEQTSFGRAFRRWTGLSPGNYKRWSRKAAL